MCRILSRISGETSLETSRATSLETSRETVHETCSSVLQRLASGLSVCLRRVATVKSSADDAEMIERLSYSQGLISTAMSLSSTLDVE